MGFVLGPLSQRTCLNSQSWVQGHSENDFSLFRPFTRKEMIQSQCYSQTTCLFLSWFVKKNVNKITYLCPGLIDFPAMLFSEVKNTFPLCCSKHTMFLLLVSREVLGTTYWFHCCSAFDLLRDFWKIICFLVSVSSFKNETIQLIFT